MTASHIISIATDPLMDEPADAVAGLLVGDSPVMAALRRMIRLAGPSGASVLLHGPTGSGKEVAARALHAASSLAAGPFIAVNCGAIPADLIESELFGHEKGSFTGASDRRIGRFEAANGGTLFLDEIGDMPLAAQVRLLRVLEECSFERIGSTRPIRFTGRVVCASHRDLRQEIAAGRFREDLWYRLAVLPITVPPLVDRRADLPQLIAAIARSTGLAPRFAAGALAELDLHDWPGNVRELRTIVMRAAILFPGRLLGADEIRMLLAGSIGSGRTHPPCDTAAPQSATPPVTRPDPDLRALLDSVECAQLRAALDLSHWRVADAARRVGMNRTTFIDRMRRHGLTRNMMLQSNEGNNSIAA